jgi:hypothetical protein
MGAPTSEVGYTSATTRRGDHEVYMGMWWHWMMMIMIMIIIIIIIISGSAAQRGLWPPRHTGFLDHTRRAKVGRTPLDK